MFHKNLSFARSFAPVAALAAALLSFGSAAQAADPGHSSKAIFGFEAILVDVAENGLRFVFDDAPVFDDGSPAYGNGFLTEGYIYPAGTLGDANGVNPDGSPEFPNLVMGKWVCRGHFVGEGMQTERGPVVITTQTFFLGDGTGERMVVTEGFELVDFGETVHRAIVGGTGTYSAARGEQEQILTGFNATMGVTLEVRLKVRAN